MMKKFYFFLAFIAFSAAALAQRSADLEVLPIKIGTSSTNLHQVAPYDTVLFDDSTAYYIQWTIVNHGPDTLRNTDSLFIKTYYNIVYRGLVKIPPGDTVAMIPMPSPIKFKAPANAPHPWVDTTSWCDSIWAVKGPGNTPISDPIISNNHGCLPVTAYAAKAANGINDLPGHQLLRLYPNPASNKLTLEFDLGGSRPQVQIILRNVVGAQVYNHPLDGAQGVTTHSIDVGHLPKGLYTAELRYNGQSIIQKVSIQ